MLAALKIFSVPVFGQGRVLVRFLGGPNGMILHQGKKYPFPCPGQETCRFHSSRPRWAGFAPVQVWNPGEKKWHPWVLQMSSALVECTGTTDLRGQGWIVYRIQTEFGSRQIEGTHHSNYDCDSIPRAFPVESVVENCMGTTEIMWGVHPENFIRPRAEISSDQPPPIPGEGKGRRQNPLETPKQINDRLRSLNGSLTPKGNHANEETQD